MLGFSILQLLSRPWAKVQKNVWAFLTLTITGFMVAGWTGSPTSADVVLSKNRGCQFELDGVIQESDVGAFRSLVASHWVAPARGTTEDNADRALCLESPGGSFQAAREISEIVYRTGIATRVRADAECVSACAVIFMAGRVRGAEGEGPRRILHVKGNLGFHAPHLRVTPSDRVSGQAVMDYVNQHNRMIADFIRFGLDRSAFSIQPSLSPALLAQLLGHGPDEMYMIDTVGKAARWNISIAGHSEAAALQDRNLVQLCSNYLSWIYDRQAGAAPTSMEAVTLNVFANRLYRHKVSFLSITFGGLADRSCSVERPEGLANGVVLCLEDGFTGLSLGSCRDETFAYGEYIPWWHGMPPGTKLAELSLS